MTPNENAAVLKKMHLIVLSNFDPSAGGMETWMYGLIPELLKHNKDLKINAFGMIPPRSMSGEANLINALDNNSKSRLHFHMFDVKWPKLPWFCSVFYQFRRHKGQVKSEEPQVVLAIGGFFELVCMLLGGRYKSSKKTLWLRTLFFSEKAKRIPKVILPLLESIELLLLKKCDLLICNGTDISEHYKTKGLNVHVIRNGVDTEKWKMDPPLNGSDRVSVAFVGRLAPSKGIDAFLESIQRLAMQDFDRLKFYVAGDGPFENEVKALESEGKLEYLGKVRHEDLPRMTSKFDVCVALTYAKDQGGGGGTSNALLEQMSAGKVIVAWDNKIFRQVLNDSNSFLVRQSNSEELSKTYLRIASNHAISIQKSQAAKAYVSQFTLENQYLKFEDLVKRALF